MEERCNPIMNVCIKRTTVMLVIISLFLSALPSFEVNAAQSNEGAILIDSYTPNNDTFKLTNESRIYVVSETEPAGTLLQTAQLLQRQFAADGRPSADPIELVWGHESCVNVGDVVILLDTESTIGADGYRLEVADTATITASDVDGLLYGGNMLLKQLRNTESNNLNGFVCTDTPDTTQRAVSLDCGRKYYSKNWICNFIREISWMGYNTLELHFSDDSGFRLDLWDEAYYTDSYKPKNDFSWICGSNYTSWTLSAYKNDPDKGKYLTTAEVVEILNTAKEYHIDIIPAFDSPSHLDYINWTYEQNYISNPSYSFYSTYDSKTYYAKDVGGCINYTSSTGWTTPLKWPYYSTMDVVSDHAKAFIFELYLDIADFFKTYAGSNDFSIGADEVNLSTYNLSSGYSFTWGFSDFVNYINDLNALLNQKGYTMRMYNDFMGSTTYNARNYEFDDNIEILYWDSPFEPTTGGAGARTEPVSFFVDQGAKLYNCIQTHTYYALRITGDGSDARSVYNRQWTFYHANEEDIYNEWYPANFSEHGDYSEDTGDVPAANLGGAYFLIWCDYACVSTEADIWNGCYDATTRNTGEFYSLRDRMWSNITKMWNWDINETVAYSSFAEVRDSYGDFPGCGNTANACSEDTRLPEATGISAIYPTDCTVYPSYCRIRTVEDAQITAIPDATSEIIENTASQECFTAIGLCENVDGALWYRVKTASGKGGYLLAAATEFVETLSDDINLANANYPNGCVQGESISIIGEVRSRYNSLRSTEISASSGIGTNATPVLSDAELASGNYSNLNNCTLELEKLPVGTYTYAVSADYTSYYVVDGIIVNHEASKMILEKCFAILQTAADQTTCNHSYIDYVLHAAGCEVDGTLVYLCSICGHVYEELIAKSGHSYSEIIIPATCQEYETVQFTCSECGDSYEEYADGVYSQWQESIPEGVDESRIQAKVFYRFSDYETMDATEATLDGYHLLGDTWVEEQTGSLSYVAEWPDGFDRSNEFFTKYDKVSEKATDFESDTQKRVIDSDRNTGYIYYHWCYTNSYYSLSYKSGSYGTFHAYYSTTAPENYVCDYSDMSYRTSHSTCNNSQWFFVTSVNTQEYTDYTKVYHYERWTDWSEWGDIPDTSTSTHKVEKKTLYRYVNGTLGDHHWQDGICSICHLVCEHSMENGFCTACGEACQHRFQNNSCLVCGFEKPVLDLCLFGYINGTDYSVETGQQIPEEFRFINDQLTLFISQDSEIAVKSLDSKYIYTADGPEVGTTSVVLYRQYSIDRSNMVYIPGNMLVTFILNDRGDDTYQLSYSAVPCPHDNHSAEGKCAVCGETVTHCFVNGLCGCGYSCVHDWHDGRCMICYMSCNHESHSPDGICIYCDYTVMHHYEPQVTLPSCTTSGFTTYICDCGDQYIDDETDPTGHSYAEGVCTVCAIVCMHPTHNDQGLCDICAYPVEHEYIAETTLPTCTTCGFTTYTCACGSVYVADQVQPLGHCYADGICQVCGHICTHSWMDGKCINCMLDCLHAAHNANGICTNCGDLVSHQYELTVTEPTCTTSGFTTFTCRCGDTYTANNTNATGHSYVAGKCTVCAYTCTHIWQAGTCAQCDLVCTHNEHDLNAICTTCTHPVEHQYEILVTKPTCTIPGFTTYRCICGASYIADHTEIVEHNYQNGVCIVCGEEEPVKLPTVNLRYPTLSFEDEVKIHVFFQCENLDQAAQIGLIVYTEEVSSWDIETAEMVIPGYRESQDEGVYYCSTQGIHAKALGDRLYFSVYTQAQDGAYYYSPLRNYSPEDYAYNQLTKPAVSSDLKALVVAMLNYGSAAQRYFSYNSHMPVNSALTEEQKLMVIEYHSDMIDPLQTVESAKNGEFVAVPDSFSSKRPAVSFKGAFSIEYFFTPSHEPQGDVTLYYWDLKTYNAIDHCTAENATGVLTLTLRDDGQYHTSVEGIAAKNLDQTVFAAAVYSDGSMYYCSGILNYHIGLYCRSFASYDNDAQELAACTAVYGYYAKAYFRKAV